MGLRSVLLSSVREVGDSSVRVSKTLLTRENEVREKNASTFRRSLPTRSLNPKDQQT